MYKYKTRTLEKDLVVHHKLNKYVSTVQHQRKHFWVYQLEFWMWEKEIMFWWGLRWSTVSHLGVNFKRRGKGYRKLVTGSGGHSLQLSQNKYPASQQVALEILHKALPLPLGNQWVIADCGVAWTCSPLSAACCFPNSYIKQNKEALSR